MPAIRAARTILLLAASALAAGQEPQADLKTFDTATIRPALATDGSWGAHFTATGFTARNVGLSLLLEEAYGFEWQSDRVAILPRNWIDRKFDIDARMDGGNQTVFARMSADERQSLLLRLLEERFKLAVTKETKEHEAFLLQVGKGGPRLGAPLVETDTEKLRLGSIRQSRPGLLVVERISMDRLAQLLKGAAGRALVDRAVIDRTGLTGRYGFTLHWAPEGVESSEPNLFTALQEQLGLRLVAAKVPVEVVVVSHVEEPSEN